jgi:hypothetical protein
VLTVMMLYLVAEGVTQTGGLDLAMNLMLGKANSVFWAQVRSSARAHVPFGADSRPACLGFGVGCAGQH